MSFGQSEEQKIVQLLEGLLGCAVIVTVILLLWTVWKLYRGWIVSRLEEAFPPSSASVAQEVVGEEPTVQEVASLDQIEGQELASAEQGAPKPSRIGVEPVTGLFDTDQERQEEEAGVELQEGLTR